MKVKVDKLKPGMILAEDLKRPGTAVVLLGKNTVLTEKHIKNLNETDIKSVPIRIKDEDGLLEKEEIVESIDEIGKVEIEESPTVRDAKERVKFSIPPEDKREEKEKKLLAEVLETTAEFYHNSKKNWRVHKEFILKLSEQAIDSQFTRHTFAQPIKTLPDLVSANLLQAIATSRHLGFSQREITQLAFAVTLADLGLKNYLGNDLKLTGKDHKNHVVDSFNMAYSLEPTIPLDVVTAIRQHHERVDGTGYPKKAVKVHPWAQIIGVCHDYNTRFLKIDPSPSALIENLYSQSNKFYPEILKKFAQANIIPPAKMIKVNGSEAEIIYYNKENPDRPIVMVRSDTDFMGWRFLDLTKELTQFLEIERKKE